MVNDNEPPPGGGPSISQRVNSLNMNAMRQRSYSQSDALGERQQFVKVVNKKKRGRESPDELKPKTKQLKMSHWLSKPTESPNNFSLLDCEDQDNENAEEQPKKNLNHLCV